MAGVFISYAREDKDFAELLEDRLTKAGYKTSMDRDILRAGEVWRDKLDQAIKASDVLVVIMTSHSNASDYVAYEWAFALGAGLGIVPVKLEDAAFNPLLDMRHHLDFTGGQRPWESLVEMVAKPPETERATLIKIPPGTLPTVRRAMAALDNPEAEEQMAGVKCLGDTDHPAGQDALLQALQHPVKNVRMAAAIEYPDPRDPRIVSGLLEASQSDDFLKQWYPGREFSFKSWIKRIGQPAVPPLLGALQDQDTHIQRFAAMALGWIGAKDALSGLIDALGHKDRYVRSHSARSLGRIGDNSAVPHLVKALGDEAEGVRVEAAAALGRVGQDAFAELVAALEDESAKVRAAAAGALGENQARPAVPHLLEHLDKDRAEVRAAAALALGRIGDPVALTPLVAAFQEETDRNRVSRSASAQALGLLGHPGAADALRAHLKHRQAQQGWRADDLDLNAAEALLRLKNTDSMDLAGKVLGGHMAGKQSHDLVELLASFGDKAVPPLIDLLGSRHSDAFKNACARSLKEIGNEESLVAVEKWMRSI